MKATIKNFAAASRTACRSFLFAQPGHSTIEYALILTLIVAVGVAAYDAFGLAAKGSFSRLAQTADSHRAHTAGDDHPLTHELAHATGDDGGQMQTATRETYDFVRLAISVMALVAGLVLCGWLFPRRRKARELSEQDKQLPADLCEVLFKKRQQILRILSGDEKMLLHSRVAVGHLMSQRVTTVSPRTSADEVAEIMAQKRIRHMIVVGKEKQLLGVISDRDIASRRGSTAGDIMTKDVVTVTSDTPIEPAITLLVSRHISCLPVVDGEKVSGVLTSTDLMMTLQCCLRLVQDLAGQLYDSDDESSEPPATDSVASNIEEFQFGVTSDTAN